MDYDGATEPYMFELIASDYSKDEDQSQGIEMLHSTNVNSMAIYLDVENYCIRGKHAYSVA